MVENTSEEGAVEAGTMTREDVDAAHREMDEQERLRREAEADVDERLAAEQRTSSADLFAGDEYQDGDLKLFEDLVGGKAPTQDKVSFVGGGVYIEPPEGGWKKGSVYRVELVVRASGTAFDDVIDGKTDQVVDCAKKVKLRIQGGTYLGQGG